MILRDYQCPICGTLTESLESRDTLAIRCECGGQARAIISGTHSATVWAAAANRGTTEPPPPGAFNTRKMAEGQSWRAWKRERQKQRRDMRRKEFGIEPKPFSYAKK